MKLAAIITIATSALVISRAAAADPVVAPSLGHVVTAPTAWMPAPGGAIASGGLDQHGATMISAAYGLGGFAAVELDDDTDVRACHGCTTRPDPIHLRRAAFKLGLRANHYFAHQPALVFAVREAWHGTNDARVGEAYVAASEVVGPVRLHAGVMITEAEDASSVRMRRTPSGFGGIEWTPPQYPRTSLIGDLAFVPRLDDTPKLEYITGIAARYQAFNWGSIELGVRHREAEGLGDAEFFVRANLLGR